MASLGLIMKRNMGTGFGNKLAPLFLSMILLANSFVVETNPGPTNKFPCGVCEKAVKWTSAVTGASAVTVVNSGITQIVKECQIKCIASWVYATLVGVV